ncbi:hypothetical protein BC939DRAFT_298606 [Gamsiella multidivaricata]|uniref:uncharacterized protein n=1 Tax=Gamsiella multidivaricata TaxID=101098 RepID=UPI00221FB856|nr:uncharacterized protein BC939DRAFT_298606 [Gamsiella multidivaricata]KAI7818232.1 hypothetical protein BC939DRAFT_298606 [Gamsiella multidivaricata]
MRYVQQPLFLDTSEGLCIGDTAFFYGVPHSLSTIFDTHCAIIPHVRKKCDNQASLRCATCKQTFHCSRECQINNWPDHRFMCRILILVGPVTTLDHTRFTDYVPFN